MEERISNFWNVYGNPLLFVYGIAAWACPMDIYYSQEEVAEGFEIGKFFAIIALVIID